jgi:uncharacterized protein YjbJ (UPF0337 family)
MPISGWQGKQIAEPGRRGGVDIAEARDYGRQSKQRRFPMNWNEMEGNWEQLKGKVQTQWGKLTNDDLAVIKGRRKELAGKIQERYGKAQEEVEREVDDWYRTLN